MAIRTIHTFQSEATAIGNGTEYMINFNHEGELIIVLDITGTTTSRTIIFECAGENGVYSNIIGYKMSDVTLASQTTGNNELWQFDLTGLSKFRARISAIVDGNVTIKGKVID